MSEHFGVTIRDFVHSEDVMEIFYDHYMFYITTRSVKRGPAFCRLDRTSAIELTNFLLKHIEDVKDRKEW